MTTIALPTGFCPSSFSMVPKVVQRMSSSPFSGSEQVVDLLNDRWTVSMTLPARRTGDAAAVEAFIASLRGMTNTANLYHFARPVPRGTMRLSPVTLGAMPGASSLIVSNIAGATLKAGDMIGISGLLLQVAEDTVADGSGFMPTKLVNRVRKELLAGDLVIWDRPTAAFRLASLAAVQYVPGYSPEVSLDFVEAIT